MGDMIDQLGNKRFVTDAKNLKEMIRTGYTPIIDYKLDSRGRLVRKKVELKGLRKTYGHPEPMMSWDEQVMILFYGLARINQLSKEQKQKILSYDDILPGKICQCHNGTKLVGLTNQYFM